MHHVDTITASVSLPVLATCRPNRAERLVLRSVECEISIPVTSADLLPPVCRIGLPDLGPNSGFFERHGNVLETKDRLTIRHDGERYFQETGISVTEFFARMRTNPFSRVGKSHLGIEKMRETVAGVAKNKLHPTWLYRHFLPQARSMDQNALLEVLRDTEEVQFTAEGEIQADLAKAEFRESLSDLLIVGDAVYVECGEPIYMVRVPLQDGMTTATIRTVDASFWPGGGKSVIDIMQASSTRFFRADAIEDVLATYPDRYNFTRMDVTEGFISTFPLEALEFDRIARALCAEVGHVFSRSERLLTTPKAVLNAWIDFRDLLESYNPLGEDIPDDIEDRFDEIALMLAEMDIHPIISNGDLQYARGMWSDRAISDWLPVSSARNRLP